MATKINIQVNMFSHPKVRRLRLYCGPVAEIYLIRLWCYAAEFHPKDGRFEGYQHSEIEGLVGWDGPVGNLLRALKTLSLLDEDDDGTLEIHDWKNHAGFVWDYKRAGEIGASKRWKRHKKQAFSKHSHPNRGAIRGPIKDPNAMELNGIELNKDSISGAPKAPEPVSETDSNAKPKPLTDIQKVVTVFKLCQGYDKDDKEWDAMYFSRYSAAAKKLIQFMGGDWRNAADCVQDVYEKLTAKGLTVTLETIGKHAAEWKMNRLEKEASRGVLPVSSNGSR